MKSKNAIIDFGRSSFLTWPKGLAERIEEREDKMACDKTHICLSCSKTLDEEEVRICECGKHTCDACGGDVETIEEYDEAMKEESRNE